jgi:hypothetical protein
LRNQHRAAVRNRFQEPCSLERVEAMPRLTTRKLHIARFGLWPLDGGAELFERRVLATSKDWEIADPDDAEMIVVSNAHWFPSHDWLLREARGHSAFARNRAKVAVYDERDRTWCWWPGAYVSMPSGGFRRGLQVAVPYEQLEDSRFLGLRGIEPDLLFSFMGNATHRCRSDVFALRHPRGVVMNVSSERFMFWDTASPTWQRRRNEFDRLLARSKFVLCPRGHGTSSIRLFETMAAGRVPVVLSDNWVPPLGPDWERCILRLPQSRAGDIPRLLEQHEERFDSMSAAAAQAFDDYFAVNVRTQSLLETLWGLVSSEAPSRFALQGRTYWFYRELAKQGTRRAMRAVRSSMGAASSDA